MKPSLYRELTGRPYPRGLATEHQNYPGPTYESLKAASVERAQFTAEQARKLLSAALGTRPHLAARVVDQLGPVLAGELARAVDTSVTTRINAYLSAERAELSLEPADGFSGPEQPQVATPQPGPPLPVVPAPVAPASPPANGAPAIAPAPPVSGA